MGINVRSRCRNADDIFVPRLLCRDVLPTRHQNAGKNRDRRFRHREGGLTRDWLRVTIKTTGREARRGHEARHINFTVLMSDACHSSSRRGRAEQQTGNLSTLPLTAWLWHAGNVESSCSISRFCDNTIWLLTAAGYLQ